MQQLTLETMVAVFQEMFGIAWWWAIVAAAAVGLIAFLAVLVRDGGLRAARFVRAELLAPVGGAAAVAFVVWFTKSGLNDIGGPIDAIVLGGVFLAGAAGAVMVAYVLMGLIGPAQRREPARTPRAA